MWSFLDRLTMSIDTSKLLPAVFNDKDLCGYDWVEEYFEDYGAAFVSNSKCDTFIGFINNYEVKIHIVVNRLTVEFVDCNPDDNFVNRTEFFFSVYGDEENMPFVSVQWREKNVIIFQYYHKN